MWWCAASADTTNTNSTAMATLVIASVKQQSIF